MYIFSVLAVLNIFVIFGLVAQTFNRYSHFIIRWYDSRYSEYQRSVSLVISIVTLILTSYGFYAMRVQSLINLTVYLQSPVVDVDMLLSTWESPLLFSPYRQHHCILFILYLS